MTRPTHPLFLAGNPPPSTHRTHKKVLSRDSFVNDVATQDKSGDEGI